MWNTRLAITATALLVALPAVRAQEQRGTQAEAAGNKQHTQCDSTLATCLMIDGQACAALSQYAAQKAQNTRVKEFAQEAVREAEACKAKLQRLGIRPLIPMQDLTQNTAQGENPRTKEQPATGNATGTPSDTGVIQRTDFRVGATNGQVTCQDMLRIKQEVAAQCLMSKRKELEKKQQGQEFDRAYVGMELASMCQARDEMQVFRRHATGELRQAIDEMQPQVERRISQLKEIMSQLQSGNNTSNNSSN